MSIFWKLEYLNDEVHAVLLDQVVLDFFDVSLREALHHVFFGIRLLRLANVVVGELKRGFDSS